MDVIDEVPAGEYVPTADQRVVMYGVTWAQYEATAAMRGEGSVPRVAFLDGAMELMSPSKIHERIKLFLSHLLVVYAIERDIKLSAYGSWTLRGTTRDAGAEPDECFIFGDEQDQDRPDLVIEIVWTSGGLDKLEIYRRLGIPEVWFWKDGRLQLFELTTAGYERRGASAGFPGLDLDLLAEALEQPALTDALKFFRSRLRGDVAG